MRPPPPRPPQSVVGPDHGFVPLPHNVVGGLPPRVYPELVDYLKAAYREQCGLPANAEVVFVRGEGDTGYLYQPATFTLLDGGTLPSSRWYYRQLRWRLRVRRAWDWLRWWARR